MNNEKISQPRTEVIKANKLQIVEPRMDQNKESNEKRWLVDNSAWYVYIPNNISEFFANKFPNSNITVKVPSLPNVSRGYLSYVAMDGDKKLGSLVMFQNWVGSSNGENAWKFYRY